LNYTMMNDDGQLPENLEHADIVLLGVSRTSKTPTSIYLANRGYKTANVPLVPHVPAPRGLENLRQPLIVFTTNYDPAIEDLCEGAADRYDLIDGFFHDVAAKAYLWRRSQFDQYPGPESKKHVVLFKVHGSTSWTKTPRGIVRSAAPIYTVDDSSHQNVLIYPARKKVAVEDPFFTAYDYFQRCMERCKLCVTIGYSFRDEDALTRLRSAASMNRDLKVLVLDPNSAEICSKKLIPLGVNAQPIGRSFGDEANKAGVMEVIRDGLALAVSSSS